MQGMQGMQGRDKLGRDLLGHAHISWIYMTTRNKGRSVPIGQSRVHVYWYFLC